MSSSIGHRAIIEEAVAIVLVSNEEALVVMGMEGGACVIF